MVNGTCKTMGKHMVNGISFDNEPLQNFKWNFQNVIMN